MRVHNQVQKIALDTATWHFAIYADRNTPDAGYVRSALQSIVQFTGHKATIKQYAEPDQIPAHQNWVFWLSSRPVNTSVVGDNLFVYGNGKVTNISSWISNTSGEPPIALYKLIEANDDGSALWRDGFGHLVLGLEKQSNKNVYHFASRFEPSWSDLVWSEDFPKMLLELITAGRDKSAIKYDKRILSDQQIMPVITNGTHTSTGKIVNHIDLSRGLWLLLVLIFVAERWLAHYKPAKQIV